jgi:XTP/dITP diphosphohydrolase
VIATGIWCGEIIDTPRGTHGFGYDPYFYLAEHQQTAAQLDPHLKNTISHRALAMHELLQKLRHE